MMQATGENGQHERTVGTVKMYRQDKGYGFFSRDDGKSDVFFHIRTLRSGGIQDEPKEGDRFEFDVIPQDGKGPKAEGIRQLGRGA